MSINKSRVYKEAINSQPSAGGGLPYPSKTVCVFRQSVASQSTSANVIVFRQEVRLRSTYTDPYAIIFRQEVQHQTEAANVVVLRQRVYDE